MPSIAMNLRNRSPIKHSRKPKPKIVACAHYLAFHGSSKYFKQFNTDASQYESSLLCLSVSPVVAACYGTHIYGCVIDQARLITITSYEWLQMSEYAFSEFKKNPADGFLICPIKKLCAAEHDATFSADMIALWHFEKCRIVTHASTLPFRCAPL